jgi:hypothetical protein
VFSPAVDEGADDLRRIIDTQRVGPHCPGHIQLREAAGAIEKKAVFKLS